MPVNNKIKATVCWVFVCYFQDCLSICPSVSQVNIQSLSIYTHILFLPAIIVKVTEMFRLHESKFLRT